MATACWDHQNCGKQGQCPAYPNEGGACWNVPGTLCRGEIQGAYQDKISGCREYCGFYKDVMAGAIKVT